MKNEIFNISLPTISNMAYSDYSSEDTQIKSGMSKDVIRILNLFEKNKIKVSGFEANDYAAANMSYISNTPMNSGNYDVFDVDIPFYQIVYKGYKGMSSGSLNVSSDISEGILLSAQSGIAPSFELIYDYNTEVAIGLHSNFSVMSFKSNKDVIKNTLSNLTEYLKSIRNAEVVDFKLINNDVRKTVFDNGVMVYVNFSDTDFAVDDIVVGANSFTWLTQEG